MIRQYTSQILEGLEYLHAHNIVHRDIKCANILIGKKNICKLTDFGGSKMIKEGISVITSIQGTANWMAPEVIMGLGSSRFSDIWSLGCTVLEMFQGEPPYNDKKDLEVFNCICKKKELPKIPEDMSDSLKDLVKKCLVFEPEKRANVYELKKHKFFSDNKSDNNNSNKIDISESSSSINMDNTKV